MLQIDRQATIGLSTERNAGGRDSYKPWRRFNLYKKRQQNLAQPIGKEKQELPIAMATLTAPDKMLMIDAKAGATVRKRISLNMMARRGGHDAETAMTPKSLGYESVESPR